MAQQTAKERMTARARNAVPAARQKVAAELAVPTADQAVAVNAEAERSQEWERQLSV